MPRPIPIPIRRALFRRWQQGQTVPALADAFDLPLRTVRHLVGRFRLRQADAIASAYDRCGRSTPATAQALRDTAVQLRHQHPTWGAGLIRVQLRRHDPQAVLPSERTLQRWFRQADLTPAPSGRRPQATVARAETPHAVWQVDAKERVPLRGGQRVSWLRLVDECSGAVLATEVFPQGDWSQVLPAAVRDSLRRAFRHWGMPAGMHVDNGSPWGSKGDWPTELALWLLGLGLEVIWNPPHQPQDNGVVERSQGTGRRWAEPHTCATAQELQSRLEDMDQIQRAEYPSVGGRSRLEAFPQLVHSGRPYTLAWERRHWSLAKVTAHLAGMVVQRRVDQKGQVSVYNRKRYVGVIHGGQLVQVMFDPEENAWVFADDQGRQLRQLPAEEISKKRILNLDVSQRAAR